MVKPLTARELAILMGEKPLDFNRDLAGLLYKALLLRDDLPTEVYQPLVDAGWVRLDGKGMIDIADEAKEHLKMVYPNAFIDAWEKKVQDETTEYHMNRIADGLESGCLTIRDGKYAVTDKGLVRDGRHIAQAMRASGRRQPPFIDFLCYHGLEVGREANAVRRNTIHDKRWSSSRKRLLASLSESDRTALRLPKPRTTDGSAYESLYLNALRMAATSLRKGAR